jgi:hypothetical protein
VADTRHQVGPIWGGNDFTVKRETIVRDGFNVQRRVPGKLSLLHNWSATKAVFLHQLFEDFVTRIELFFGRDNNSKGILGGSHISSPELHHPIVVAPAQGSAAIDRELLVFTHKQLGFLSPQTQTTEKREQQSRKPDSHRGTSILGVSESADWRRSFLPSQEV